MIPIEKKLRHFWEEPLLIGATTFAEYYYQGSKYKRIIQRFIMNSLLILGANLKSPVMAKGAVVKGL